MLADEKEEDKDTHSFSISLACALGGKVEKAILVGSIHHWIGVNEKNAKPMHLRDGEYWTYDTAKDLEKKHPYLKEKSISRWLGELEADGWIKTRRYGTKNTDRTLWYGRGEKLLDWLASPIPQNEETGNKAADPIPQNEISIPHFETRPIPHFETSIPQNEISIPQNEECNIKDTIQTAILNPIQIPPHPLKKNASHEVSDFENLPEDVPPNSPVARPPLSPDEQGSVEEDKAELETFTKKLQNTRRLVEGLYWQFEKKLSMEEIKIWVGRYVLDQWTSSRLKGRHNHDLIDHCQKWIKTERERETRTNRYNQVRPGNSAARGSGKSTRQPAYLPKGSLGRFGQNSGNSDPAGS